jgi:transposase
MKPYSEDLRTRIVRAVEVNMSKSAAAHLIGISLSSVTRYARLAERGDSPTPRKGGGRPHKADETTTKLHKGERVRELIEERGCELLYLPP